MTRELQVTPRRRAKSTGRKKPKKQSAKAESKTAPSPEPKPLATYVLHPEDWAEHSDAQMFSYSFNSGRKSAGQPAKSITRAVIEAEAQRRLKEIETKVPVKKYGVSQQFWTHLPNAKRYSLYKSTVKNHEKKVRARLEALLPVPPVKN